MRATSELCSLNVNLLLMGIGSNCIQNLQHVFPAEMTQDVHKVDVTESHTPVTPRVLGGRSPMC